MNTTKRKTLKTRMEAMFGEKKSAQQAGLLRLGFSYECYKCGGNERPGYIRGFDHIANGRCFACWGLGFKGVLPVKVTKANIEEIEASFAARKEAGKAVSVRTSLTSAGFAVRRNFHWIPSTMGRLVGFSAEAA